MEIEWKEGFEIKVCINDGAATISANREGLLSLSEQLKTLADQEPGCHVHYDEYNSLENGSDELIVEKI